MAKAVDLPSLDAFSESLRQLQALHQRQVFALLREVAQLRAELGRPGWVSSPSDSSVEDAALEWSSSDGVGVMAVQEGALAIPEAPDAPETLELPEEEGLDLPEPLPKEPLPKAQLRQVSAPGGLPGLPKARWRDVPSALDVPTARPPRERWRNLTGRDVQGLPDLSPERVQDLSQSQGVPGMHDGQLKEDFHPRAGTKESSVRQGLQQLKEEFHSLRAGSHESSPPRSDMPGLRGEGFNLRAVLRSERSSRSGSSERSKLCTGTATFVPLRSRRARLFEQYDIFRARNPMASQSSWRTFWTRVVSTPAFDFSMGCVIALNAIAIGVESSIVRGGGESPVFLAILDHVFLVIYFLELCARFGAMGCRAIWSPWVQLDLLLVLCGLLDVITQFAGVWSSSQLADHVDIVRTLRLARLARMVRLMVKSNTLWMLVQGLLNSLGTLVWTCVILLILLFLFSVLGLELLMPDSSASEEYNTIANEHFGSLLRAMTTLIMGLSLDNFGEVYRPVVLEKPFTAFYFVPFFLLVPVALMNLVTALMVNSSMEQTRKDKDAEEQLLADVRAEKVKILEEAFREIDANHSNRIDLGEMMNAHEELRDLIFDVADIKDARQKDLAYIFNMLDFDNSGYVDIHEFCEGLLKLKNPTALSTYATVRYCSNIANLLKDRRGSGVGQAVARVASSLSMPL